MKIYNCEQGSEEWIKCRLGKLTASTAQAIATNGKGLETLCLEKTAELLTGKPTSTFKSGAMEHGNEFEDEARSVYELETGNKVNQIGFYEYSDYVGVSPDGLIGDDGLIEIKCPTDKTYTEYLLTLKIKPEYYAQMQMQMYIMERKWCDYVVYNSNFKKSIVIKRVFPDTEFVMRLADGIHDGVETIVNNLKKIEFF